MEIVCDACLQMHKVGHVFWGVWKGEKFEAFEVHILIDKLCIKCFLAFLMRGVASLNFHPVSDLFSVISGQTAVFCFPVFDMTRFTAY